MLNDLRMSRRWSWRMPMRSRLGNVTVATQQPERHLFLLKAGAVAHGHGGRAHFYGLAFDRQGYLAVLRQAPLRDVHQGANLQVGNDADPVVLGDRRVKNGVIAFIVNLTRS